GQGMPAGNEPWNAGQLPAFPGAADMPRAVSPPAAVSPPLAGSPPVSGLGSRSDNIAPPQLPMANRDQEVPYPASGRGADIRYNEQPSYSNQAPQGFPSQGFPS